MLSSDPSLKELREHIDETDAKLIRLLTERLAVVSRVGEMRQKTGEPIYVPSREAEIIRELARRIDDRLPLGTMVRMWRELLAAAVRLEGRFAVAVYAPANGDGVWDLARDHYGSQVSMQACDTALEGLRAVTDRRVAVAVLPMPQAGDPDPWWMHLLSRNDDAGAPRVIARLPFGPRGNARSRGDALVIGYGAQQSTEGGDRTLLATENGVDMSQSRFSDAFSAVGMKCRFMLSFRQKNASNTLIEVDEFVAPADPRLDRVREWFGGDLRRLVSVGCYAVPLPEAALGARG